MTDEQRAVRRLAVAAAIACLTVAGLAVAADPRGRAPWLLAIVAVVAAAVLVPAALALLVHYPAVRVRPQRERDRAPVPWHMLLVAALLAALAWALSQIRLSSVRPLPPLLPRPQVTTGRLPRARSSGGGFAAGPWVALGLALLVLAVLAVVTVQQRRTTPTVEPVEVVPADPLALAVEAALLDLEDEEDPRRAVIKAYASTEAVLREHGLPRRPAEAPLEYLDRVLRDLGAKAGAVDRLTRLFEHAAFSTHDVDGGMRAEAVATFHGLRDTFADAAGERS